jgi:hypothetical protein
MVKQKIVITKMCINSIVGIVTNGLIILKNLNPFTNVSNVIKLDIMGAGDG